MHHRLPGGVARADDVHVLPGHRARLGARRAVEDAGADEVFELGHADPPPGETGGEHDGPGGHRRAVGRRHHPVRAGGGQAGRPLVQHELDAEQPRLLHRAVGEVRPADAALEAQVVADQRAGAGLPAGHHRFQDHRAQPLRGGVDRGGEAGRPGADDGHVVPPAVRPDAHAQRGHQRGVRRVLQDGAVEQGDDRERRRTGLRDQRPALGRVGVVEPVRDRDPAQHVAQLVRPGGVPVAGDPQRHRRRLLARVPRREELAHRRVEDPFQRPPRPVEVEVGAPEGHGGDRRVARRPVAAVHQQHPLGAREPGMHPLQRLHGVGEDQRDPVRLPTASSRATR